MEQRGLAKGNAQQPPIAGTQGPGTVSRGLLGVREAARRDKKLRFTALLHHIDLPLLRASFEALKREASPGVDGVRWVAYREELDERLENLHERIHTGRYRALPSKRVCIPKDDGSERLLGIAALEDKVVLRAVVTVLNHVVANTATVPPLAQRAFSPPSPKAGAVCGNSARTDLPGGCLVRGTST